MATKKVTITIEEGQLESIRRLVELHKVDSVSAFVTHAVAVSLADVAGWATMLKDALAGTGGPLTRRERAWADSVLLSGRRTKRRRKAA